MDAIVYRVDENGERIPPMPNWRGEIKNVDGALWLSVEDAKGETIYLQKGDRIHLSNDDIYSDRGNYIVTEAWVGRYRVERY